MPWVNNLRADVARLSADYYRDIEAIVRIARGSVRYPPLRETEGEIGHWRSHCGVLCDLQTFEITPRRPARARASLPPALLSFNVIADILAAHLPPEDDGRLRGIVAMFRHTLGSVGVKL